MRIDEPFMQFNLVRCRSVANYHDIENVIFKYKTVELTETNLRTNMNDYQMNMSFHIF